MKSALVLLAWLVGVLVDARAVQAQAGQHALIISEQGSDKPLAELGARLRGELSAAGFEVSATTCAPGVAPRAAISAAPAGTTAVILVRGEPHDELGVELWISDRVLGTTSNARLASDHPDPSERARRISVEAAELLRARLTELRLHRESAPQAAPTRLDAPLGEHSERAARASRAVPRSVQPWLGAGLMMLAQADQTALLPSLSAGVVWRRNAERSRLSGAVGGSIAGYGRPLRREREQGELELQQGLGAIELVLSALAHPRLALELMASAGVYGLGLRGQGVAPFHGRRQRDFSAVLGAGLGLRFRLLFGVWLRAVGGPIRAFESSSLQIVDTQVARVGGLMWVSRLELWAVRW